MVYLKKYLQMEISLYGNIAHLWTEPKVDNSELQVQRCTSLGRDV